MIAWVIGILSGGALPLQTSINTRLRERVRSPWLSTLISFTGGALLLLIMNLLTGGIAVPLDRIAGEPLWMWTGGLCGVILVTLNILLLPRLGSVQTVILCVLGQILTGLMIDHFGLFRAPVISLSPAKVLGAVLVIAGVSLVSYDKNSSAVQANSGSSVWIFRLGGLLAGAACATQVAVNGYLNTVTDSAIRTSFYSFSGGVVCAGLICLILLGKNGRPEPDHEIRSSWWLYCGGMLGVICVVANVYLMKALGTGMAVVVALIGQILGGILVDLTGFLGAEKKPMTIRKGAGLIVMLIGAAMIQVM